MRKGQDNWGGTCTLVNNLEVSHEWGKDEITGVAPILLSTIWRLVMNEERTR